MTWKGLYENPQRNNNDEYLITEYITKDIVLRDVCYVIGQS